jgi:hypothetical protein
MRAVGYTGDRCREPVEAGRHILRATSGALAALPELARPDPAPEAARMTGTDPDGTPISEGFALHLPYGGGGSGRDGAVAGGTGGTAAELTSGGKPRSGKSFRWPESVAVAIGRKCG